MPAIIFALRIIIASPSKGVSVIALGVGALTISALHAFKASRRAVCRRRRAVVRPARSAQPPENDRARDLPGGAV